MAETCSSRKTGPRNKPLGSGMSKRRRGKRRVTFFAPVFQLGVAWILSPSVYHNQLPLGSTSGGRHSLIGSEKAWLLESRGPVPIIIQITQLPCVASSHGCVPCTRPMSRVLAAPIPERAACSGVL